MVVKVTSNTDDLLKSLEEAKKTITRKLEGMVVGFTVDMAEAASGNTPVGNEMDMRPPEEGGNDVYHAYYVQRAQSPPDGAGLPIEPGFHQGAWEFGMPSFRPIINDVQGMLNDIENEAESRYKLGDTVVIGAEGPGYGMLFPRIQQPTIDDAVAAYKLNIQGYYDRS